MTYNYAAHNKISVKWISQPQHQLMDMNHKKMHIELKPIIFFTIYGIKRQGNREETGYEGLTHIRSYSVASEINW